jgi:hypothetical protein
MDYCVFQVPLQGFCQKIFLGYDGSAGEARSTSAEDVKSGLGPPPEQILAKNALEVISRHLDALF